MRACFYVDGFNLYYRSLKGTGYKWLDLEKLARFLVPEHRLVRLRYFTAIVEARQDDPTQQQRQQAYLRALRTLPVTSIHLGRFVTRVSRLPLADPPRRPARIVAVRRSEEKGSDVNLATALLTDVCRSRCEVAVVVSNDSDLVGPIRTVREEFGIPVGVVITDPRTRKGVLPADFHRRIRTRQLEACQLDETLHDRKGPIHKPSAW